LSRTATGRSGRSPLIDRRLGRIVLVADGFAGNDVARCGQKECFDPSMPCAAYVTSIIELEDTEMSDLVAIIYPSEAKAEEVRQRLFKLQKEYLITISDAVIAVKTEAGPIKLNQLVNTTAIGAVSGSFWGLLIGVIFLNPILGVALGAASGALGGALSDYGIDDAFMKELSTSMQPGNAALFVLIKNMTPDKVLREIQDAGGTVLKTSLDDTKEQQLRDALAKASTGQAAAKTNAA
jgi:uncharacterized membrane protein